MYLTNFGKKHVCVYTQPVMQRKI